MAVYTARCSWQRNGQRFTDNAYSRRHQLAFDGGVVLPASSSPHVVRVPFSDPQAVDPEEMLVASVSSCHMLWFLSLAAEQGWLVDSYDDAAEGVMTKSPEGKLWVSCITLRPTVLFGGNQPDEAAVHALHHAAHEACFIANSLLTEIRCEPVFA